VPDSWTPISCTWIHLEYRWGCASRKLFHIVWGSVTRTLKPWHLRWHVVVCHCTPSSLVLWPACKTSKLQVLKKQVSQVLLYPWAPLTTNSMCYWYHFSARYPVSTFAHPFLVNLSNNEPSLSSFSCSMALSVIVNFDDLGKFGRYVLLEHLVEME
jgi:hypothetical protein